MDFIKDNQKEMKTKLPILLLACLFGCVTHQPPPVTIEPPRVVPITVLPSFEKERLDSEIRIFQQNSEIGELSYAINLLMAVKLKTNHVIIPVSAFQSISPHSKVTTEWTRWNDPDRHFEAVPKEYHITIKNR